MSAAATRVDRIRRGFNRLGWLALAVMLMLALLLWVTGLYRGDPTGEANRLALVATGLGIAATIVVRAFGWAIAGFFPDN